MDFTLSDLLDADEPSDKILNSDGTFNLSTAQEWVSNNIEATQQLFGDGAGLHIGRAQSGLAGFATKFGVGVQAGAELTVGIGANAGQSLFGSPKLNFGATASGALVAGVDWTAGSVDLGTSNDSVLEPAVYFGTIEDLQGISAGIEFSMNVNGLTGGFGAVVPVEHVDDVMAAISEQLSDASFTTSGDGRQAIADVLSEIFPPGSMLIGLAGRTTTTSVGATLVIEGIATGVGSDTDTALDALKGYLSDQITVHCFLADTPIQMWPFDSKIKPRPDGSYDEELVLSKVWEKPISKIKVGDVVVAYADNGNLSPKQVSRTMINTATHILDFWGTGVTAGHAYYCTEGEFKNRHVPLMDILRTDGAIMLADGTEVRAATNFEVGSIGDLMIHASATKRNPDGSWTEPRAGKVRFGTHLILPDQRHTTFMEIAAAEGWRVSDDGYMLGTIRNDAGELLEQKFHFPYIYGDELPQPEDYILARSNVTLGEIYAAGEWEQIGTKLPAPSNFFGLNVKARSSLLSPSKPAPNIPTAFAGRSDAPVSALTKKVI